MLRRGRLPRWLAVAYHGSMRKTVAVLVFALAATSAAADTIYLKNGRVIRTSSAIVEDDRVVFVQYGHPVTIPLDQVDRVVEDDEVGPEATSLGQPPAQPVALPAQPVALPAQPVAPPAGARARRRRCLVGRRGDAVAGGDAASTGRIGSVPSMPRRSSSSSSSRSCAGSSAPFSSRTDRRRTHDARSRTSSHASRKTKGRCRSCGERRGGRGSRPAGCASHRAAERDPARLLSGSRQPTFRWPTLAGHDVPGEPVGIPSWSRCRGPQRAPRGPMCEAR